jgi:hypothetical protein
VTKGEYRVGINFNPSADDMVGKIKRAAADLIDLIETIPQPKIDGSMTSEKWANASTHLNEVRRLQALAQTDIESAAMWAVKAATKPPIG